MPSCPKDRKEKGPGRCRRVTTDVRRGVRYSCFPELKSLVATSPFLVFFDAGQATAGCRLLATAVGRLIAVGRRLCPKAGCSRQRSREMNRGQLSGSVLSAANGSYVGG